MIECVGLMYFGMQEAAPEGFAGPNDHWHRHSAVCTKYTDGKLDVPFPPDADVTKAQCDSVGGFYMAITGWMVHTWVVPRVGEPGWRLLPREPQPPMRRRHLRHRRRRQVRGHLSQVGGLGTVAANFDGIVASVGNRCERDSCLRGRTRVVRSSEPGIERQSCALRPGVRFAAQLLRRSRPP